jgi:hypothetical protein
MRGKIVPKRAKVWNRGDAKLYMMRKMHSTVELKLRAAA